MDRAIRDHPSTVLLLLIGAVCLVGWFDYLSGPDLAFSLFYLPPIAMAGWCLGRNHVVAVAAAASFAWLVADLAPREAPQALATAWNGVTRLAIFMLTGLLIARVVSDRDRLQAHLENEKRLSRTDAMTGLLNPRGFSEILMREASRARRDRRPMIVAYIDVDNFKDVNDRFGHAAGDNVLSRVAATLRECIRSGDVAARLGGDEFAILFHGADADEVEGIAGRVIDRLARTGRDYPGTRLGASIGVACFQDPPDSAEELLWESDRAMYEAKSKGKGNVVVRRLPGTPALAASHITRNAP